MLYKKFADRIEKAYEFIGISFLPERMKQTYKEVINDNAQKLELY